MSEKIDRIKKIVSFFIKVEPDKIGSQTIIDNSILQGSVKIHMMYGEIADNGYKVSNYSNIKTFGELLSALNMNDELNETDLAKNDNSLENNLEDKENNDQIISNSFLGSGIYPSSIGIDLLNINKLPRVNDFRESSFYVDNFSSQEIAYCVTKKDPYKSFAGKFAAKEAIVKVNNYYKSKKFNEIEILNKSDGMPYFANFSISISHEDELVIAIATDNSIQHTPSISEKQESIEKLDESSFGINNELYTEKKKTNFNGWLIFSLLVNIIFVGYIIYLKFLI